MTTGSYATHAKDIRTYVDNNFSTAPMQFPNQQDFDRPVDSEWVRMTINESTQSFPADMAGEPRYRFPGVLTFQVFTPTGHGDNKAREIADELVTLFRNVTVGNTQFDTPGARVVGRSQDDESWYQMNVVCPYRRDTITFDNE